jgi:hypothetical protein
MNMVRMIGLAAALACSAPLHAQVCSGGPEGGADSTGNQCSTPGDVAGFLVPSRKESPQLTAKTSGWQRSTQALQHVRPVATAAAAAVSPMSKTEPTSRFPKAAATPVAMVKNSKVEPGLEPECSGGTDGGMDASGNQCNQRLPADVDVHSQVAAAH